MMNDAIKSAIDAAGHHVGLFALACIAGMLAMAALTDPPGPPPPGDDLGGWA